MSNKTVETKSGERVSDFLTGAKRGDDYYKPQFTRDHEPIKLNVAPMGNKYAYIYLDQNFMVEHGEPINFALPYQETDTSMIPELMLNRLGGLYLRGAAKYARNNWKKGMNLKRTFMSLFRHVIYYWAGDTSEDHLAAIIWNAATIMWTEKEIADGRLPKELADIGPMK